MARSHVRLQFGAWRKPGHTDVSKDARWLYVTILCDETLNQAGVVRIALEVWADDAGMKVDEARVALDELAEQRFVVIDRHELLVRTFVRNDGVSDQPNVLRNALEVAHHIRSPILRRALAAELRKLPPPLPDKVSEKTGRVFSYPDPHACADEIDPDGAPPPEKGSSNPSPKGSLKGSPNPSRNGSKDPLDDAPWNSSPNPSGTPSRTLPAGTLPEPLRGRGRGRGEGFSSADGSVGGSHAPARARPTPHDPPCEKPCNVCRAARLAEEAAAERDADAERASRAAWRTAVDTCELCDDQGYRLDLPDDAPVQPCVRDHPRPMRAVS